MSSNTSSHPNIDLHTIAVNHPPEPTSQSINYPIYMSSNFQYAGDIYDRIVDGERHDVNIYGRCGNPTEYRFEEQMTLIEGASSCLATASGMAAIAVTLFGLLGAGDHVVADWTTYSTTHELLSGKMPRLGIDVTFVDTTDLSAVREALTPATKVLYFESVANPTMKVADLGGLADLGREHGVVTVCDNTFASPAVVQPHRFGVDIVVESATKFIGGHNDALGGTITMSTTSGLLPADWIETLRWNTLTKLGGALSPFNAWLLLRGTQTLPLRVDAQASNAHAVAEWLESDPRVERVWYPGIASHPQHELAARQFSNGGAMLAFQVSDETTAVHVLKSFNVIAFAASLGGVRSVAQVPASMAFLDLPPDERAAMGIRDGMIRVSIGLERPADLIADIDQALSSAIGSTGSSDALSPASTADITASAR